MQPNGQSKVQKRKAKRKQAKHPAPESKQTEFLVQFDKACTAMATLKIQIEATVESFVAWIEPKAKSRNKIEFI